LHVRRKEGPSGKTGLLVVSNVCVELFLIGGLIVLSTAALLRGLAGLVRHLVGLAGLVTLLRLIRLVLLCHGAYSSYQQALLRARATVLMEDSSAQVIAGLPIDSMDIKRLGRPMFPSQRRKQKPIRRAGDQLSHTELHREICLRRQRARPDAATRAHQYGRCGGRDNGENGSGTLI
jgi:hypothetical protein